MIAHRCFLLLMLALLCLNTFSFAGPSQDTKLGETNCTCKDGAKNYSNEEYAEILGGVTIAILIVLVGMSIVFEKLKECALEKTSKLVKPVIQSALGEFAVLGFISLILFLVESSNAPFSAMSKALAYKTKHLIHVLHMALFLVMILFIVQIGILLVVASSVGKKWKKFEHQRGRVNELASDYRQAKTSAKCLLPKDFLEELEYHSLREAFIHPRQGSVFEKYSAPKPPRHVDHSFNFAGYLNLGLSHTLCEMVEVGLLGWISLALVAVFFWSFRFVDLALPGTGALCPAVTAYVLSLSGYLLPVLTSVVSCKLKAAKQQLLPPKHQFYLEESTNMREGLDVEAVEVDADAEHPDIPSYLKLKPKKSLHCCCCHKHKETRHDNLFWFGAHGVEFLQLVFSVELLLCSAYWGTLWSGLLYPIFFNYECAIPTWSKVLLVCIHIPPPVIVAVQLVPIMSEFVLTSFVEEKRCHAKVKEVLIVMKTRTVLRIMKLINAMHHATINSKVDAYLERKSTMERERSKQLLEEQKKEDASPRAAVVKMILSRCPADFTPVPGRDNDWTDRCAGSTAKLQKDVEAGQVQLPAAPVYVRSERLSKEEGTDVYFKFTQNRFKPRRRTLTGQTVSVHKRVSSKDFQVEESMQTYSNIFDAIDTDHDGSIGYDELAVVMKKLGFKDVTERTVQILINRLDSDNDGKIDKMEFLRFFESEMREQTQETMHQMVKNVFTYLDTDNSGSISTTEFMEAISKLDNGALTREDVEEIVRMADADGNGEISLEELTELVEETTKNQIV